MLEKKPSVTSILVANKSAMQLFKNKVLIYYIEEESLIYILEFYTRSQILIVPYLLRFI